MYAKLLPFQELLLAALFSAAKQFLHFLSFWFILHVFADFETAKKPNETAKKPDETAKKKQGPKMIKMCKLKRQKKLETAKI